MPKLKGRTATVLKDGAMELVATDEEDPLLAFWPIGLGRTAVFASDVKDRWAATGSVARLRSVLRVGGERAAASARAAGVAGDHAGPRARRPPHHRRRDRSAGCQRPVSNLLSPAVQVRTANAADGASATPARASSPARSRPDATRRR